MYDTDHHPTDTHGGEAECSSGRRNRYYRRKELSSRDFRIEQDYTIARRRLLSRAIAGWGVAYGFDIGVADGSLRCGPGLALDRHGRELLRTSSGPVAANSLILLDALGEEAARRKQLSASEGASQGGGAYAPDEVSYRVLLQAHYAERGLERSRVGDDCCGETTEWNHLCETILFSLRPLCPSDYRCPTAENKCRRCSCHEYETAQKAATEVAAAGGAQGREPVLRPLPEKGDRGTHHCLCEWQTAWTGPGDADPLCRFGDFDYAADDAVPLACLTVRLDRCGCPVFEGPVDECTPRRLIKTNDMLFDLIRGCDLTVISDISWGEWHRRADQVDWSKFKARFPAPKSEGPAATEFSISFSGPVRINTLSPDAFAITCLVRDSGTGAWNPIRIPVVAVEPIGEAGGLAMGARLAVDRQWRHDEVGSTSRLSDGCRVEIEIRGDFILDCQGQAVDANAVGRSPAPSGNGTPGGTYLSTFRVRRKPPRVSKTPAQAATDSDE